MLRKEKVTVKELIAVMVYAVKNEQWPGDKKKIIVSYGRYRTGL
jgi:hypothetical protein